MRHECTQAMRGVGPESMWLRPYRAARAHPAYRHRYRQQADCRRQVLDNSDDDDVYDPEDDIMMMMMMTMTRMTMTVELKI